MRIIGNKEEEEGSPIHGDLLEVVLAYVPLVDLACACRVSKSWEGAVSSSLSHINKVKPWLLIHPQCKRSLHHKTTQAYDPRSDTWIELSQSPLPKQSSTFLSSGANNLLYELSATKLSFSVDPLRLNWCHVRPPHAWRVDPIVALVGHHIVVAGGASEFEEDPLVVEMYDMETSRWSTCQSMPVILKDSAASTWLSVASNQDKMYVTEKASGVTYSFSPITKTWAGPYNLLPDPSVYLSVIGFAGEELILAGLFGNAQNVSNLKIWKIKPQVMEFDEIGEIPSELLKKFKGESPYLYSISLMAAKDFLYIFNSYDPAELIFCEMVGGGSLKWGSVKNVLSNDRVKIAEKMVMSCGIVELTDLHIAMSTSFFSCKPHASNKTVGYISAKEVEENISLLT